MKKKLANKRPEWNSQEKDSEFRIEYLSRESVRYVNPSAKEGGHEVRVTPSQGICPFRCINRVLPVIKTYPDAVVHTLGILKEGGLHRFASLD